MIEPNHFSTRAPGDESDYPIEWDLASGDSIVSALWIIPEAFTQLQQPQIAGNRTTVWLRAGTPGLHEIACTITTAYGQVRTRTIEVVIAAGI